ncbi:hypothetical protein [Kribbella sp. CA-247076]|uniref:hypothetical protein n=1 Tax=Kribbella sp. CA-247076 TaxID=3239941 RepID=UPI003D8CE4D4
MSEGSAKKTCFIAMPITTAEEQFRLYGDEDHWTHVMESLFVPAVQAAGFEPWRPVARGSFLIHALIVRQLEQADMVLCDISHDNPNVFFELGVRTSVNKPIAIVRCDPSARIPFDVSGINTHTYDPSLKAWKHAAEIDTLAQHIRDAETSCAGENPLWRQFGLQLTADDPSGSESKEEALLAIMDQRIRQIDSRLSALGGSAPLFHPLQTDSAFDMDTE